MARMAAPAPTAPTVDPVMAEPAGASGAGADLDGGFEVATVGSDTLRAGIRIVGALTKPACAVLVCVLRAHLRAGRHYLRVDVADATLVDDQALGSLVQLHRQVTAVGGMLVLENAGPHVIDALGSTSLFVRAAC
jgi:anti-anti-sigma regulatory factor